MLVAVCTLSFSPVKDKELSLLAVRTESLLEEGTDSELSLPVVGIKECVGAESKWAELSDGVEQIAFEDPGPTLTKKPIRSDSLSGDRIGANGSHMTVLLELPVGCTTKAESPPAKLPKNE